MRVKRKLKQLLNELSGILTKYIRTDQHKWLNYEISKAFEKNKVPLPAQDLKEFYRLIKDPLKIFRNTHREKDGGKSLDVCLNSIINLKQIKKHRKTREDGTRRSLKYKGRKRGDFWEILEKAYDIVTFQHIKEWEKVLGIDKVGWLKLSYKLSEAFENNIKTEELFKYLGLYSEQKLKRDLQKCKKNPENLEKKVQTFKKNTQMVEKIIDEHSVLWAVYERLKMYVAKAIKRQNKDDIFLLRTVKKIWGDHAKIVLQDFKVSSRGKPTCERTFFERLERIIKIMEDKQVKTNYPGLSTRDMPAVTCWIAFFAYQRIYKPRFLRFEALFKNLKEEKKRREAEIKRLEYELNRIRAISDIQKLVDQYNVRSYEIQFIRGGLPVPRGIVKMVSDLPTAK